MAEMIFSEAKNEEMNNFAILILTDNPFPNGLRVIDESCPLHDE